MNQHSDTPPRELHLTEHRVSGASVWDKRGWDGSNELELTRWLIGLGGSALAIEGFRRRGASGSLFAGLGGTLVWWAMTGHGDLTPARRWLTNVIDRLRPDDAVFEASAASFPASDPPSFTPAVGTGTRPRKSTPR